MATDGSKIRVCVVMASSRVGQAAISALIRHHESHVSVRAVFRSAEKAASSPMPPSVDVVAGIEAMDASTHGPAFEGIESAFIIAPQLEHRVAIVNALLDGAHRHGVRHAVLIGGVFQEEERFLFHRQWMATRRHAQGLGLTWTQLECSDFMENVYRSQRSVREERRVLLAGRGGVSRPVALPDVGRAAAAVLAGGGAHRNRSYRVVGPTPVGPADMAGVFSDLLGCHVSLVDTEVAEARQAAIDAGIMPKWQAEGFYDWVELYYVTGKLRDVESDIPLLGFDPIDFRSWLAARISDFQ